MENIEKFIKTVEKLRSPDGCPWDKEQTHYTLRRYFIEETYEAIDAIEKGDSDLLKEELGDVLLQIVLHCQIASEESRFTFEDVAKCVNEKMIVRHPHVFDNKKVSGTSEVLKNWEEIKSKEKPERKDPFDGIPGSLPALLKALKISKKAAKKGFEWKDEKQLLEAFKEEAGEVVESFEDNSNFEEEIGDLLFMIVNLSRWKKIDPEDALNKASKKFIGRFTKVNKLAGGEIGQLPLNKIDELWERVKLEEKK